MVDKFFTVALKRLNRLLVRSYWILLTLMVLKVELKTSNC